MSVDRRELLERLERLVRRYADARSTYDGRQAGTFYSAQVCRWREIQKILNLLTDA